MKRLRLAWTRVRDPDRLLGAISTIPALVLSSSFWRQHAIDPLTAPALLLDRSFQLLTVALLPAVLLVLLASTRVALYSVVFTAAVSVSLGTAVVIGSLVRPPADVVAAALGALCVVVGSASLGRYARRVPQLHTAPAGALAFFVAAAIPLLQFWNGAAFLPTQTEASLTQTAKFTATELVDGQLRTTLSYDVTNLTSTRMISIANLVTVCWWGATETPVFEDADLRYRANCKAMRPIANEAWVSPETSQHYEAALAVPAESPRVTVIARIAFARGDRLRTSDNVKTFTSLGTCRNVRAVRLEEESRLKSLSQQDKYLVYADFNGDGGLNYFFDAGPDIVCPGSNSSELARYFGRTNNRVVQDTWLSVEQPTDASEG